MKYHVSVSITLEVEALSVALANAHAADAVSTIARVVTDDTMEMSSLSVNVHAAAPPFASEFATMVPEIVRQFKDEIKQQRDDGGEDNEPWRPEER